MLRSRVLMPAVAAGMLFAVSPASAQDACMGNFDQYGDPNASIACACDGSANGVIYGTLVYTSDSDICTAAVHAGQISGAGTVKLRGTQGCESYEASTQNGVSSNSWSSWDVSFYFPGTHDGSCATQASEAQPQPQPQPPAGGDALSMILALSQTAPPGVFSYQSANSLGPTSFELIGVTIAPDGPGSPPLPIDRVLVENIDMAGLMQGAPSALDITIEGMELTPQNSDLDGDFWDLMGTDSLLTNIVLDFTMDQVQRGFTLNDFTIDFPGVGKATLALDLLGVGAEAMMSPEMAMFSASMKSASLTLEDETFFARAMGAAMAESGMNADQLLQIGLQEFANGLAEIGAQPGDPMWAAAEKVAGLLVDAEDPQGPLTVSVNPAQPVSFAQLNQLSGAAEAAQLLNLAVTYAGSVATIPDPSGGGGYEQEEAFVFTGKDVYAQGETVDIYWSGMPGNAQDWITVVPASAPDDEWGQYVYTDGQVEGYYEVNGLPAGDYEVRAYYDWPDGGFTVQSAYYFIVE